MGLIVDSSVWITAERRGQPVSGLLRTIKSIAGTSRVMISAVGVIEICHGIWRANTPERMERRRLYVEDIFQAVAVQPFTREMGEMAARIDAEARKAGIVIPFADLQIGVTALQLGHSILTDNIRHFNMIPNLLVQQL